MAQQGVYQIADPVLANSVITNPSTRICFALGANDAQKLSAGFTHYDANDLMNLGLEKLSSGWNAATMTSTSRLMNFRG